jgi:hypothetical protein
LAQNGFLFELTSNNVDVKYHQLWSDIKTSSQKLIKFDREANSLVRNKITLSLFAFKVFAYSFFLNKLRFDDPDKFKAFTRTCLSQLSLEMEELVLRAEESILFHIPGHFHRDQEYLREKFQYYIEDVEKYTNRGIFPKYTFTSIIEMPFDYPQDVFLKIATGQEEVEFLKHYNDLLKLFSDRYNNTSEIKTEEEIEHQKLKIVGIPKEMQSMNLIGVDDFLFGSTTGEIISKIGEPDKHSKYSGSPDEYLCYHNLGIEFAFAKGTLMSICTFSGRPEGWGETRYKKYVFTTNVAFTMDSTYEQIIMLYGPPSDEKEFLKAKVPCVRLSYGQFQFTFNMESKQIIIFSIKTK